VKILGRGELAGKVDVAAHAVSKSAKDAIEAAGGTVTLLPLPYKSGRPPVKGNQFTNR
jgi:large subunit ribosomal protein L15